MSGIATEEVEAGLLQAIANCSHVVYGDCGKRDCRNGRIAVTGKDLKRLFLVHKREIQSYLTRRLRDAELAADLTQETFLRYAEQGQGAAVISDRSYLFRTARNLATDHMRQRMRQRTEVAADGRLPEVAEERPSPDAVTEARQTVRELQRLVMELPERTRRVFVLVRVDGLSYAETAARLGISESAVQKHLAAALHHVMLRLRQG